jgi:N-dimethylarginine dimethylaminohydrolase
MSGQSGLPDTGTGNRVRTVMENNLNTFGGQSEVGAIERLLLRKPTDAWATQAAIAAQWKDLNYLSEPNLARAEAEYDAFCELLHNSVANIEYLPGPDTQGLDSLYVRDASIITDAGLILCNMGKEARRNEPQDVRTYVSNGDIPILGEIKGEGTIEGGDLVWLDKTTLVVGRGYRTNDEGIKQLWELTADTLDELVVVPLPHWNGPGDVLHLMSMLSPVDHRVLAVYSRLLSVPFREWLLERDFTLVEVPDEEYDSMACNILTVSPGKVIMLEGNPRTQNLLEQHGVEVHTYSGEEISKKGCGGPTCLTRPLLRSMSN